MRSHQCFFADILHLRHILPWNLFQG